MDVIFFLLIAFCAGGLYLGRFIGKSIWPDSGISDKNDSGTTIIHNHFTENHLHISNDDLKELNKKKP